MHKFRLTNSKHIRRLVLLAYVLLAFITEGSGQTLMFTEGFEANFPPAGWSLQNYAGSNSSWFQSPYYKNSGIYGAVCFPGDYNGGNSWLFTKAVTLQTGKFYLLNYYARTEANTSFKITIGNSPDLQNQQKIIRNVFSPTANFVLINDTIVCEKTGTYYIGFNNYSSTNTGSGASIDDVNFYALSLNDCTSIFAGTVSASVVDVCPNVPYTISNTNATINKEGLRYAWQKSYDGVTWTNITNSFSYEPSLQVTQTSPTYYRLTDTCLASGISSISNQLLVNNASFLTCYCTPPALNCGNTINFTNVTILNSGINNTSTCSGNGYSNFISAGNAIVYRNQNIYIQHTIRSPYTYQYTVGVWVDVNHNGVFEENEFVANGPFSGSAATSQFLVPAGALTGETTLRLKTRYYFSTNPSLIGYDEACNINAQSGETEDYKVTIADPPNCTGSVSAGTISSVSQTCPNNSFTITTANATFQQGQMRYAWQRSTDNINWSNINNTSYLINPFTISENSSYYYRLTDTCISTGQSAFSNALNVTATDIFGCYCTPVPANCSVFSIDSVSFNTIHNSSSCSANGYSNFTNISTTVNNGTILGIYLKLKNSPSIMKYAAVWIDFNRNGILESSEKVFSGSSVNDIKGFVSIPFNVMPGEALMRVLVSNASYQDPCQVGTNLAEIEDYKVILSVTKPLSQKFCYYVKQSATGVSDGSSWGNAFTSLASAFLNVHTGDTIKVAKGIYTPGSDNASTFQLKDSVIVLGGFPDTGNPLNSDRNFSEFQTVMSGEIGVPTDMKDNSQLILQATGVNGFTVDGFIIENGYSDYYTGKYGPVYLNGASGKLINMVIRKNYSYNKGSAVNTQNSKLLLQNCFIENNINESVYYNGSAFNILANSQVTFVNSVIAKNRTISLLNQSNSSVKLLNCTVFKNNGYSIIRDTSNLILQNSIFYANANNYYVDTTEFKSDTYSSISVSNSITELYKPSSLNYLGNNPKFIDTSSITGADNKYYTNDDGLRLINPCSPAINAGNNNFDSAVATDIAGDIRVKNGTVDLGAYEVQAAVKQQPAVLYVNKSATGLNDGSSWQNAFTDLQTAFYYCSDTIKVAKGAYPVSSSDPFANFRLSNNRVIMGGYPNTGSPTNKDINTAIYPTQLDGKINSTQKCQNIITSVNNDTTCRLIGFEIINSAPPFYQSDYATIKVAGQGSPYFEDIKINGLTNQAENLIAVKDQSNPKFYKCKIYNGYNRLPSSYDGNRSILVTGNSAPSFVKSYIGKDTSGAATTDLGAAFLINGAGGVIDSCTFYGAINNAIQNQNSYITIRNSVFTKTNGRNIVNTFSQPYILNCTFNDTAFFNDFHGGSTANFGNSDVNFINCRFFNSYSYRYGGACANENSNAVFKNCVFRNCISGFDAGALYNLAGHLTLINCIGYNCSTTQNVSSPQAQFLKGTSNSTSSVINSTIIGNTTSGNSFLTGGAGDSIKVYNTILWRFGYNAQMANTGNDISTIDNNNPAVCDIRNSILFKQPNTVTARSYIGLGPKLIDMSSMEGNDNLVVTDDDGLKPCTCSPAINAGDNSLNPEAGDIASLNRKYGGTIDIGAYEVQAVPTSANTFYVKENAPAGGDGLNWSTAYNRLQNGLLNNCADTVKIAKGTYKPAVYSKDSSFNIYKGTVIFGGYPNIGNPGNSERNAGLNPTILSGDIGIPNDSTDNSYSVLKIHCPDTTVLLDGVTIEKGNYVITKILFRGGGGIQANGNKLLTLNNCIVRNNNATAGGGLFSYLSNVNILKTVISNNNSTQGGGYFIEDYYTPVDGKRGRRLFMVKNSVFTNNSAGLNSGGTGGGGVYIAGTGVISGQGSHSFENVVFYKNAAYAGAGVCLRDNTYISFINCTFAKNNNTGFNAGAAIYAANPYSSNYLNTYVYNTIFYGNLVMGALSNLQNGDFNWQNGSTQQATIPGQNLMYSVVTGAQTGSGAGNINSVVLKAQITGQATITSG